MKIKENFVLRQVADTWVVLPLGDAAISFDGMIKLNESSALLWKTLENGCSREDLAKVLTEQYDVDYERALRDVDAFLRNLSQVECIE